MYAWYSEGVGSRGRDPVAVVASLPFLCPDRAADEATLHLPSLGLLLVLSTDEDTVVLYTERAEAPRGHPAGSQRPSWACY